MTIASQPVSGQPATISAQLRGPRPGRVLDFSNGPEPPQRGGRDPDVPMVLYPVEVRGRLLVGHTRDLGDQTAPIYVDPAATVYPGQYADLRCEGCVTRADIARGYGEQMAVLEHQDGCPMFAAVLARAHTP